MSGTQSPEEIHCVSAESREKGELPFTGHQGTSCVLGILGGLIRSLHLQWDTAASIFQTGKQCLREVKSFARGKTVTS